MSDPIKVSKPVRLDVDPSKVFEFYPNIKKIDIAPDRPNDAIKNKKSMIFLDRGGKIDVLKIEKQRTKIFSQVAKAEPNLKDRQLVELTSITSDGCSYTYKQGDEIFLKTIPLKEISPEHSDDYYLTTVCKTEELTLRHFTQEPLGHAILEGLKSAFQFLATPFSALYRLIAGGEARDFADMLVPIKHDQVWKMDHDRLLAHIDFMGSFLQSLDPKKHEEEGLEAPPVKQIYYMGKLRLCRECTDPHGKPYLKIRSDQDSLGDPKLKIHETLEGIRYEYEGKLRNYQNVNIKKHTVDLFLEESNEWRSVHCPVWKRVTLGDPLLKIHTVTLYKYNGEVCRFQNENHKAQTVELYVEGEWKQVHRWFDSALEITQQLLCEYDGKLRDFKDVDAEQHSVTVLLENGWKTVCWRDPELEIKEGDHGQICYKYDGKLCRFKNLDENQCTVELLTDQWDNVAIHHDQIVCGGEVRPLRAVFNKNMQISYEVQIGSEWRRVNENEIVQTNRSPFFASDSLTAKEKKPIPIESAFQQGARLFKEAACIGMAIHRSRNSGDKSQTDGLAYDLCEKVLNLDEKNRHLIVPFGQGEGGDYVPHFLVFEHIPAKLGKPLPGGDGKPTIEKPAQLLMKHISFASTSLGKKIQPMTTYRVKETQLERANLRTFFQSLISIHPYSCSKDDLEVSKKGPLVKDPSLERLLLEFAQPIQTGAPKISCSSRDPVKALFTVLKELGLKETHFSEIDNQLSEITSSKGNFFKFYVDRLVEYYENHEDELTTSERTRALEGIAHYAEKVRHYMEKEIGVDAALAITHHLLSFVEKKLEGLKQTEELEQKDLKNLESSVNPFKAVLSGSIEKEFTLETKAKNVEGSRILIEESIKIGEIRNGLTVLTVDQLRAGEIVDPAMEKTNREHALKKFNHLLKRAEGYLNRNDPLAAKTLLLNMLEAIPTPRPHDPREDQQVWDKLELKELDSWLSSLEKIGALMFEASARSGTFPLAPHEVFELHVVLPLLTRYLFQLTIPKKIAEFDKAWAKYLNDGGVRQKLTARLVEFIKMRESQIEAEVTKQVKDKWKKEDEDDAKEWRDYRASQVAYGLAYAAYLLRRAANDRYAYAPNEPVRPQDIDVAQQEIERQRELKAAIQEAKAQDLFLGELRQIQAAPIETLNWNLQGPTDRLIAVMGSFAQIMGMSGELIGYKMCGLDLIQRTGYGYANNADIWLMNRDCSVWIGSSPDSEKRYRGCMRAYRDLHWHDHHQPDLNKLTSILIGYHRLGDGTQFNGETTPGREEKRKWQGQLERHQKGFFNSAEEGSNFFAPDGLSFCRQSVERRKILGKPENYLQPYSSGILGNITNLFGPEFVTEKEVKRKLREMPRIYLVATQLSYATEEGCFCLSSQPDTPTGVLSTKNGDREAPPDFTERKNFFGQANAEQYGHTMGGDEEREEFIDSAKKPLFPVNAPQDFLTKSTAMTKDEGPDYSCLSVSECFKLISLDPSKLAVPSIQHTLFKTFLQHDLIRDLILDNPQFFILNSKLLNEMCQFFASKEEEYRASELFIREICNRIRRHTQDLQRELQKRYGNKKGKELVTEICKVLPEYSQTTVGDVCLTMMDKREQKEFATFALSFYCDQYEEGIKSGNPEGIDSKNVTEWIKILNAFYIMQKSPIAVGHTTLQAELTYKVQTLLLPAIGKAILEHETLRNHLLDGLSGQQGVWAPIPGKEYAYALQGLTGFTIDLRTGMGFCMEIKRGNKCKLPGQIRAHEHYKFLFADANPTTSSHEGDDGQVSYLWKDEEHGRVIEFLYNTKNHQFQIFQQSREKRYLFQKPTLNESQQTKFWGYFVWRTHNRMLEQFIKKKGIWIDPSAKRSAGSYHALLAQYDQKIHEDPIHLEIIGDQIVEASIGKDEDKKIICSSLSNRHDRLIQCRDENGLLLLSKDRRRVDEIRFPRDQGDDQLVLKRSDADPSRWVVGGREEWEWVLTDTKDYEKSFGKDWRQYLLILKNRTTQEEEIWIFPHMMTVPDKREGKIKFLTSAYDIFKYAGGNQIQHLDDGVVLPGNLKKLDFEVVIAFIGAVEGYFGGLGHVMEALEIFQQIKGGNQSNAIMEQLIDLLKSISSPRGIRYQKGKRGEKSTYSGFFYLSYIASRKGDWGAAIRYLELMTLCGYSTPEDAKQFQKMVLLTLGFEGTATTLNSTSISNGIKALFAPQSPKELAYRAKLAACLLGIRNHVILTEKGMDLFDLSDQGIKIEGVPPLEQLVVAAGSHFYTQYRQLLPKHGRELREVGLLVSQYEEKVLTQDKTASAIGGVTGDIVLRGINQRLAYEDPTRPIQPIQLDIPTDGEITEMVKAMGSVVQQTPDWSIHALHKKEGSYPKWTTVLANFWSYWDWILNEDIAGADLVFLFQEIPPHSKYRKEVNTARSLLLLWRHYCKQKEGPLAKHRKAHKSTMEGMLADIRIKQLDVANLGGLLSKVERDQKEAANSPSFIRLVHIIREADYVETRQKFSELTYTDDHGDPRGSRFEFEQCSQDLLLKFLSDAIRPFAQKEEGYIIKINGIGKHEPSVHIVPAEPIDPTKSQKERALQQVSAVFRSSPLEFVFQVGEANVETKKILMKLLDLPSDIAWNHLLNLLQNPQLGLGGNLWPPETITLLSRSKAQFEQVLTTYQQSVGFPANPYPKKLEKGNYEEVKIRPPSPLDWGKYFTSPLRIWKPQEGKKAEACWEIKESVWEERAQIAIEKYEELKSRAEAEKKDRQVHEFQNKIDGIKAAKKDLKKRTASSLDASALKTVYKEIHFHLNTLREEEKLGRKKILDFARSYANELGILSLFADRHRFTQEQIFNQIIELYRRGQLGRLNHEKLQVYLAELITETLLVITERQQYEHALGTCKTLSQILKRILVKLPRYIDSTHRKYMAQTDANRDPDWLLQSVELKKFLNEGSGRLRYVQKTAEGLPIKYCLKDGKEQRIDVDEVLSDEFLSGDEVYYKLRDQQFTRSYLAFDFNKGWIAREKAIDGLEKLLRDIKTSDQEKAIPYIEVKMGTGKSDFMIPIIIELLTQNGYRAVMITTDQLVPQLQDSIGPCAFIFKFDIHFGLHQKATAEQIQSHLKTLLDTLNQLEFQGKAVLTATSQLAALRDKRIQLQNGLNTAKSGIEKNTMFEQLQLIKQIEAYFNDPRVRVIIDEDDPYAINFEHNYALGDYETVDRIRFEVAERLIYMIYNQYAHLWDLIVNNNLRAIEDVTEVFRVVAAGMYDDLKFWMNAGWTEAEWNQIDRNEFIKYILGLQPNLPHPMPKWDPDKPDEQQKNKAVVAALKTFLSETLKSVHHVNPKLERGIAPNGITVVPYSDGSLKEDTLYGNEPETILHHIFHYLGCGNKIGETVFDEKFTTLGALDLPISSLSQQTWKEWAGKIATEAINMNCDKYIAFLQSPRLALERFQLLRHLMLESPDVPVRVYREQITYNCQELSIPRRIIGLCSGTGNPYALNLADYTQEDSAASIVWGETILCLDFNEKVDVMGENETPLDYIKRKAKDPCCQAFLNYDYKIKEHTEDVVADLRQVSGRQIIYRDHELAKKMWHPGEQHFPMPYEAGAIAPDAIFFYDPKDSRGVHFHIPRGGKYYGIALFGIGNEENPIAQLFWRMRHLDNGHTLFLACDKKTERQIRTVFGLNEHESVTQGHALIYFTLNSIEEKNLLNVKATIFRSQKPVKDHLDAVVGNPYDMQGITDPATLADFEGKVIFPTARDLYITNSCVKWIREYQPQIMIDAIQFVIKLYAAEKGKIKEMKQRFSRLFSDWIAMNPSVRSLVDQNDSFMWVQRQLVISSKNPHYQFEDNLSLHLKPLSRQPESQALLREMVRKMYAIQSALLKAEKEVEGEEERLEDKDYKKFLKNNLPKKIASDPTGGAHAQQKIEQQEQQQQQQQQEQVERVYSPVEVIGHTHPIDPLHFKKVALGIESIKQNQWHKYDFSSNGNFLPLSRMLRKFKGIQFPRQLHEDLYEHAYISERAWSLIRCMGQNGVPAFDLFVIQGIDGKNYTVITTPAEREQTMAPWMLAEREKIKREKANLVTPPPPPYTDQTLWDDLHAAIDPLVQRVTAAMGQPGLAGFIRQKLHEVLLQQKAPLLPSIKTSLSIAYAGDAWEHFTQKAIETILSADEINGFRATFDPHIQLLKDPFLTMHKKFQMAHRNPSIDPKINSDRAIVLALSNEIFPQPLILDSVSLPEENTHFLLMVALNKIYLNWTQFTLLELDLLMPVINNLELDEMTDFVLQLEKDHSKEMADYIRRMYLKDTELGKKWRLEIVNRKLEENHIKQVNELRKKGIEHPEPFSTEEEKILEAWIIQQGNTIMATKLERWERMGAHETVAYVQKKQNQLSERAGSKVGKT